MEKIKEKAYEIDFGKIEGGFLYSDEICYASSRNQARQKLLEQIKYDSLCLSGSDEEVNYLTIPVKRAKGADKYKFEDKELTKWQILKQKDDVYRNWMKY